MCPNGLGTRTAFGSRLERPDADLAYERCEMLSLLSQAMVDISVQPMLDQVAELFASDDVYIYHYREDGVFVTHGYCNDNELADLLAQTLNDTYCLISDHLCASKPVLMDFRNSLTNEVVSEAFRERGFVCLVSIPSSFDGELFGIVSILYRRECPWTKDDEVFLRQVGTLLGANSQRLYKSERQAELKVLDERRLIAAEIHDDIAQLASSLAISADTVEAAYEMDNKRAVEKGVRKIREAADVLNNRLRDHLVSLNAPLEHSDGLIKGIQNGLDRLEAQWGIQTHFEYDKPVEQVSMRGEVQLMRVVTECFSNIIKHSHASHVDVCLTEIPKGYLLVISDDGDGFDIDSVPSDRFGLKIMRERMAMANGIIDIESTPKGTTITAAISRL